MWLRTLGGLRLEPNRPAVDAPDGRGGTDVTAGARVQDPGGRSGGPGPGPKALVLLAYLAREGPKERRHLAELFWRGVSDPRNGLSTALTRLRRAYPEAVEADNVMVAANVASDEQAFVVACQQGRFEDAAALYRGPYLDGIDLSDAPEAEEWLLGVREALARRWIDAACSLGEKGFEAGDRAAALRWSEAAWRQVPAADADETLLRRLHRLLVGAGSPMASDLAREAHDLGVDLPDAPMETLQPGASVRPRTPSPAPLPAPPGELLGRDDDLARLDALLRAPEVRLVTLVGPGGVGKTRLALEAALRLRSDAAFPGGAVFVPLAEARASAAALETVARACGSRVRGEQDVLETLADALGEECLLVVLDNVEQIQGLAMDLASLVSRCPSVKLLLTSRTPTRLPFERQLPVDVLPLPEAGLEPDAAARVPSVTLFVRRAQAVAPDFRLAGDNVEEVVALCRRLDGLPLAIELAAARAKLMTPAEILARLDRRLDVLAAPTAGAADRHRTLRDTLDWSFASLDEDEQQAFRRLALYAGAFPLEAAERMSATPDEGLRLLEALVDHSLVRVLPGPPRRFAMLATVRTYGRERLAQAGDRETAERSRAAFILGLAEEAGPHLTGAEQHRWFDLLSELHHDLGAALRFLVDAGDVDAATRVSAATWRYWVARGHLLEAGQHLERVLAMPLQETTAPPDLLRVRAEALEAHGAILLETGAPRRARARLLESLAWWERLGRPERVASTLNHLSWLDLNLGALVGAEAYAERALASHVAQGDLRGQAVSRNNLGWIALVRGDTEEALRRLEQALAARRASGDKRGVGYALANLALVQRLRGDLDGCAASLDEADATLGPLQDEQLLGWARVQRAALALAHGDPVASAGLAREAVELARRLGQRSGEAEAWTVLAEAYRRQGRVGDAVHAGRRAFDIATDLEEAFTTARAGLALGRALVAAGRGDEADAQLREVVRLRRWFGDEREADAVDQERLRSVPA